METYLAHLAAKKGVAIMKDVFSQIYKGNLWGDYESVSGPGSRVDATLEIARALPELIERFEIETVLDAACGDFNWMGHLNLEIERYIGVDIVPELIEKNANRYTNEQRMFKCLDISSDVLPAVDLIICRDCLVHLSFELIWSVIKNFKNSGSKYLLTTTFTDHSNNDIKTGDWRWLNLQAEPFSFPPPLWIIIENPPWDKSLALWDLSSIQIS